jgi:hypothetical protein
MSLLYVATVCGPPEVSTQRQTRRARADEDKTGQTRTGKGYTVVRTSLETVGPPMVRAPDM